MPKNIKVKGGGGGEGRATFWDKKWKNCWNNLFWRGVIPLKPFFEGCYVTNLVSCGCHIIGKWHSSKSHQPPSPPILSLPPHKQTNGPQTNQNPHPSEQHRSKYLANTSAPPTGKKHLNIDCFKIRASAFSNESVLMNGNKRYLKPLLYGTSLLATCHRRPRAVPEIIQRRADWSWAMKNLVNPLQNLNQGQAKTSCSNVRNTDPHETYDLQEGKRVCLIYNKSGILQYLCHELPKNGV